MRGCFSLKTSVPLYHHLKMRLLNSIQEERWQAGELIPSEAELAREMGVSRITVRRAIGDLVSMGYLVRQQGKGTFVALRGDALAASRLQGFAEELRFKGHELEMIVKRIEVVDCPDSIAKRLCISPGTAVIEVCRLASIQTIPIFREVSFIVPPPQATLEDMIRQSHFVNHIYGFFEQCGVRIAFGKQRISAARTVPADVSELQMPADEPVLSILRVTSDETGSPVEFSEVRYPSSRYQYEVNLSREDI